MKKNRISKNWINKQKRDIFVRQSKVEGYRSRAVYKLIQINEKFTEKNLRIIRPGHGLAPKYYNQVLGRAVNRKLKKGTAVKWDYLTTKK